MKMKRYKLLLIVLLIVVDLPVN